jgi:hypothetical protein
MAMSVVHVDLRGEEGVRMQGKPVIIVKLFNFKFKLFDDL